MILVNMGFQDWTKVWSLENWENCVFGIQAVIHFLVLNFVVIKLQSKVQTSVLGLGVDFVLPLSQQEQQEQQQQEEPHQNREFDTEDHVLYDIYF